MLFSAQQNWIYFRMIVKVLSADHLESNLNAYAITLNFKGSVANFFIFQLELQKVTLKKTNKFLGVSFFPQKRSTYEKIILFSLNNHHFSNEWKEKTQQIFSDRLHF